MTHPVEITPEAAEIQAAKAEAYDCLAQIEHWQMKLRQLNERIAQLRQPAVKGDAGQ